MLANPSQSKKASSFLETKNQPTMSTKYTPISAVSGGRKNLKMCVRVAHIWLIRERKVPTSIIFMNMLLVDEKVFYIFALLTLKLN